jgi:hypothetical protein
MKDKQMLHPPRDMCIKLNMSDKATMFATFTYTAEQIHRRGGDAKYAVTSSQYRLATIQTVKERVGHGPVLSETTMLTVIVLVASVCEKRAYRTTSEQEQETQMGVQRLRAMIAVRGLELGYGSRLLSPSPAVCLASHSSPSCRDSTLFPSVANLEDDISAIPVDR